MGLCIGQGQRRYEGWEKEIRDHKTQHKFKTPFNLRVATKQNPQGPSEYHWSKGEVITK